MADALVNLWDRISIYCINHPEAEPMKIVSNTEMIKTPFYGCSNYFKEKISAGVAPCPNRLNLDDYQGIVLRFMQHVSENGLIGDYTNYTFDYKGSRQRVLVRVLKYTDYEIRLGIRNKTIFGR